METPMKKIARRSLVVALIAGAMSLAGCQSASKGGSMGLVNSRCPMMPNCGTKPSVANSVDYKGQKVGFCCGGCIGEWNQLSDSERDAKLAAVK
jgi:hypothetical protein